MQDPTNPYAAPEQRDIPPAAQYADTDAEQLRREYLQHETSVRAAGTFSLICGVLSAVGAAIGLFGAIAASMTTRTYNWKNDGGAILFGAAAAIVLTLIGIGLRRLDRRIRMPVAVLGAMGMLVFPCGTVVGAIILTLLANHQGVMVFSKEYAEARRLTPHIIYRNRPWTWIIAIVAWGGVVLLWLRLR